MKKRFLIGLVLIVAIVAAVDWLSGGRPIVHDPEDGPDLRALSADMGRSTNLLAVGGWSEPVKDATGYTLRGRLLIFEPSHYTNDFPNIPRTEYWGYPSVYLELQNLSPRTSKSLAVYFSLPDGLACDVRDAHGAPPPSTGYGMAWDGPITPFTRQQWTTVPFDGSVRLRADVARGGTSPKPTNMHLMFGWSSAFSIPAGSNDYYLSGTFSPPTNHPPPPGVHVWNGLLKLPAVRIPQPKP